MGRDWSILRDIVAKSYESISTDLKEAFLRTDHRRPAVLIMHYLFVNRFNCEIRHPTCFLGKNTLEVRSNGAGAYVRSPVTGFYCIMDADQIDAMTNVSKTFKGAAKKSTAHHLEHDYKWLSCSDLLVDAMQFKTIAGPVYSVGNVAKLLEKVLETVFPKKMSNEQFRTQVLNPKSVVPLFTELARVMYLNRSHTGPGGYKPNPEVRYVDNKDRKRALLKRFTPLIAVQNLRGSFNRVPYDPEDEKAAEFWTALVEAGAKGDWSAVETLEFGGDGSRYAPLSADCAPSGGAGTAAASARVTPERVIARGAASESAIDVRDVMMNTVLMAKQA